MSKFKVGDKVRIVKRDIDHTGHTHDCYWAYSMDNYTGLTATITSHCAGIYHLDGVDDIAVWGWEEAWLDLINEGEQEMSVTPKELRDLKLSKDDRRLRTAGLVDEKGALTDAGKEIVLDKLFPTVKDEIVADMLVLEHEAEINVKVDMQK